MNAQVKRYIEPVGSFSEEETELLVGGASKEEYTPNMTDILQQIGLLEDVAIVPRNLKVILDRPPTRNLLY